MKLLAVKILTWLEEKIVACSILVMKRTGGRQFGRHLRDEDLSYDSPQGDLLQGWEEVTCLGLLALGASNHIGYRNY